VVPDLIIFKKFDAQFVHKLQFSGEISRELKECFVTILPDRRTRMNYTSLRVDNGVKYQAE